MANAQGGPVPVVVMGLGFIGQEIARAAHASPELTLVGAVDRSPLLVGRRVGELIGVPSIAFKVSSQLEEALGRHRGAVLLHATGSRLPQVMDQLLRVVAYTGFLPGRWQPIDNDPHSRLCSVP